jgi:hypothetical protein
MNINDELTKLKADIVQHQNEISNHSFALKTKVAKVKKLEKQLEKINEIINEPLQTPV